MPSSKILLVALCAALAFTPALSWAHRGGDDHSPKSDDKRNEDRSKDDHRRSDRQKDNSKPTKVRLSAKLTSSATGVRAKGRVDLKSEGKKNRSESKLQAQAKLLLPNLGITTGAEAASAEVELVLLRGGVEYGRCFMEIDDDNDDELSDDDPIIAEYKLHIEQKVRGTNARTRDKKGTCDIDLANAGIQVGIPAIQAGDTVRVEIIKDAVATPFLQGTF